jgi:hypothetical protein
MKHHLAENNMTGFTSAVNQHTATLDGRRIGQWIRHAAVGFALLVVAASPMIAEAATRVTGEPARASLQKTATLENSFVNGFDPAAPTVNFIAVNPERIEEVKLANIGKFAKALQIGVTQLAADESFDASNMFLRWTQSPASGYVAQLKVLSPGALATRVAIQVTNLPAGSEIRFAGSDTASNVIHAASLNEVLSSVDATGLYWTPMTDGDTQLIEVFAPSTPNGAGVAVAAVSHIFATPRNAFKGAIAKAIGTCYVDPVCNSQPQASRDAKSATAHMVFVSGGQSFVCTGTLLNDTVSTSQIPYFFSANHCIGTQTEANTLITYWNYENASCGTQNISRNDATVTAVQGGATLLYANEPSDVLLLQLRGNVPPTAFFAGWDSAAITGNTNGTVFHHPGGDPKKISSGVTGSSPFSNVQQSTGIGSYITFAYLSSSTEGGSSGSALFSTNGGNFFFRGGLFGGDALCSNTGSTTNPLNRDYYSRFDLAFPTLKQWLDPTPTSPLPAIPSDIFGERRSTLTWVNTNGAVTFWRNNGTAFADTGVTYGPYPGWTLIASDGDYDGDGKSDLLWQRTDGAITIWLMNGTAIKSQSQVGPYAGWSFFSGNSDFNGDGKTDLIWQRTDGAISLWTMNGGTLVQERTHGPFTGWRLLSGNNDFDGDGKSDLLWRRDTGAVSLWLMEGVNVKQVSPEYGPYPGWTVISGSSDYNGDGKTDLTWEKSDNAVSVWLMDGATSTQQSNQFGPFTGWRVVPGKRDFDGDGKSDLLWQRTDGAASVWLMNGVASPPNASISAALLPGGGSWQLLSTRNEFNGDGKTDLVWQTPAGQVAVGLANGVVPPAPALLGPYSGWSVFRGTTPP